MRTGSGIKSLQSDIHIVTDVKKQTKEFKLSKKQKEVLVNLKIQMESCQWKILFLTVADFVQLMMKLSNGSRMVELVTSISVCVRNLILFIVMTIGSPKYVDFTEEIPKNIRKKQSYMNDIDQILQGVKKITKIFSQLVILGTTLAIIQFSSAAAKWPFSTVVVSCLSAVFMAVRLSGQIFPKMEQIQYHYLNILLEPKQVKVEANSQEKTSLLVSSPLQNEIEENEYEFSRKQEMVILSLMDTMSASGHGLLLLSLSDCLLILVNLVLNPLQALSIVGTLVDDVLMAVFIIRSSRRFELILGSTNHDMSLLLEGLGEKQGISKLFTRLGKVAFGVGVGKFVEVGYKLVKPYFEV